MEDYQVKFGPLEERCSIGIEECIARFSHEKSAKEIDKRHKTRYNGDNAKMEKQYRNLLLPKRAGHWLKARAEDLGKDISGAGV